jgi:acetoin:2,6-dichlorophenolindophenol oxidoreductase subunit alpha
VTVPIEAGRQRRARSDNEAVQMTVQERSEEDVQLGIELLRRMVRIRRFEERVRALHAAGSLLGAVHLYIGQEAVAAGVCSGLRDDDFVTSNHRGHGHVVAKGGDLMRCMAELFGRATGYCQGKGGSMHIADMSLGIIGANGIVGAGIPIATGAALSAQLRGTDQVSVCFFGDGAANEGSFHESLNLAAIWSLPVLFVCENNGWGEATRMERVTARGEIAPRADAYGIPGLTVDGNDPFAVHAVASEAVARARAGHGPTLIEAVTGRIYEHSQGVEMILGQTRTDEELAAWRARDPIDGLRVVLEAAGVDPASLDELDAEITAEVEAAVEFAQASPLPEAATAFTDVWAETAAGTGGDA